MQPEAWISFYLRCLCAIMKEVTDAFFFLIKLNVRLETSPLAAPVWLPASDIQRSCHWPSDARLLNITSRLHLDKDQQAVKSGGCASIQMQEVPFANYSPPLCKDNFMQAHSDASFLRHKVWLQALCHSDTHPRSPVLLWGHCAALNPRKLSCLLEDDWAW